MFEHSDLIEQIQAAAEITGDELLVSAASALSSQSLSLSEARDGLGSAEDWSAKLAELYIWSGSAFLAGEKVDDEADHKSRLYGFLCGLIGYLMAGRDVASVLENGPTGLADATNDPADSDLSSLRKGAQVAVKPLEWLSHAWGCEADGGRYRIEDNGTNWTDDRYWLFVDVGLLTNHRSKYDTLEAAKSAAQSDFETRIRSALVSGSREGGDA